MRKGIAILLAGLLCLGFAGCASEQKPADEPDGSQEFFEELEEELVQEELVQEEIVEVTDEALLQSVWENLLYDSITSIGNQDSFASTEELSIETIARFSYFRYQRDYGKDALEAYEDGSLKISESQIVEMSERYLDRTDLDFSEVSKLDHSYLPDENAFGYYMVASEPASYKEDTPWGIRLDKLERLSEGRYRATLVDYVDQEEEYVQTYWRYELGLREDSSWYFISSVKEHPENHLVSIEGEYSEYSSIGGYETKDNLNFLYQMDEDRALVSGWKASEGELISRLGVLDLNGMEMVNEIDLMENYGIKLNGQKILIKGAKSVSILDDSLNQVQEIVLPQILQDVIEQGTTYDDQFEIIHFFRSYDIAADLNSYCYGDEEGLKLLNGVDSQPSLLSPTLELGYDLLPRSYYIDTRFIQEDIAIVSVMSGYEGLYDRHIYVLDGMTGDLLDVGRYGYSVFLPATEQLLLASAGEMWIHSLTSADVQPVVGMENVKGALENIDFTYGDSDRYLAFATTDYENESAYIHRIDLETNQVEANVLRMEGASVYVNGVLNDGRILASYERYPNEYGYVLTAPSR